MYGIAGDNHPCVFRLDESSNDPIAEKLNNLFSLVMINLDE